MTTTKRPKRVSGDLYHSVKQDYEAGLERLRELSHEIQHLKEQNAGHHRAHDEKDAHIQVLLSDRDRLTAAIEILSRRLASPTADKHAHRAGWRAQNETPFPLRGIEKALHNQATDQRR